MLINLSKYVFSQQFIDSVENDFDTIVYERDYELVSDKIQNFGEYGFDFAFAGAISGLVKENKKILIILDQLEFCYFWPFLKNLGKNVTFVLTNVSFAGNKNDDIFLPQNIKYTSPFDQTGFEKMLKNFDTKVIRLSNMEYPVSSDFESAGADFLASQGLDGPGANIIFPAYMLAQMISMNEQKPDYSYIMLNDYDFSISKTMFEVLNQKENYFLCDQSSNSYYALYINNLFLRYNLDLKMIFPNFELKTLNPDYVFEDAKFDAKGILEKIS